MNLEEDVVFEGSALHKHLADLQLLEPEAHPSFLSSSHKIAADIEPTSLIRGNDAVKSSCTTPMSAIEERYHHAKQYMRNIYTLLLQEKQQEEEFVKHAAVLLTSRGLLSHDDGLYLYYFSSAFNKLMENEVDKIDAVQQSNKYWLIMRGTTISGLCMAGIAGLCHWLSLPQHDTLGLLGASAVIVSSVVYYNCSYVNKYKQCYQRLHKVVRGLTAFQCDSIPLAFTAISDALLLHSPSDRKSRSSEAYGNHVVQLQRSLHRCLRNWLSLLQDKDEQETLHKLISDSSQNVCDVWPQVKVMRRQLEVHISTYCRNIFLIMERSSSTERSDKCVPIENSDIVDISFLPALDLVIKPLFVHLPEMDENCQTLMRQVNLVKDWWLHLHDDVASCKSHRSEEQIAGDALTLHLQSCLLTLEEIKPSLPIHPSLRCNDNSNVIAEQTESSQDKVLAKISQLREKTEMCLHDLTLLEETLLSRNPKNKSSPVDTIKQPLHLLPVSPTNESDINPCVPYIAEDEVFEISTEVDDSALNTASDETANQTWLEDIQQEERSKKKMRAQGKRVLTELQPILNRKKEEFEQRENVAKLRMQGKPIKEKHEDPENNEKSINGGNPDIYEENIEDEIVTVEASIKNRPVTVRDIKNTDDVRGLKNTKSSSANSNVELLVEYTKNDSNDYSSEPPIKGTSSNNVNTIKCITEELEIHMSTAKGDTPDNSKSLKSDLLEPIMNETNSLAESIGIKTESKDIFSYNDAVKVSTPDIAYDINLTGNQSLYSITDVLISNDINKESTNKRLQSETTFVVNKTIEPIYERFISSGSNDEAPRPSPIVVSEVFVSEPNLDCDDTASSLWNFKEKPVTLHGRLEQMFQTHMIEKCLPSHDDENCEESKSSVVSSHKDPLVENKRKDILSSSAAIGLDFQSILAKQAVGLSSKFGINRSENMFGAIGEREETFGDDSEEESSDEGSDSNNWCQTDL